MSVNLLYCEGGEKSPDIRLLSAALVGACGEVKSAGSKYGFAQRVRLAREFRGARVAGVRDRDFNFSADLQITETPRPWREPVNQAQVQLGWHWERVEIENYLIDPSVVARALGAKAPPENDYSDALRASSDSLAVYTAARCALSQLRPRLSRLNNDWGQPHGKDAHRLPDNRQIDDCRVAVAQIVADYTAQHQVDVAAVLARFESSLSQYQPGGGEHRHCLTFFSGKDLLFGMETALKSFGFQSPYEFRERILKGIENAPDNVWTWLPEWGRLRDAVQAFDGN